MQSFPELKGQKARLSWMTGRSETTYLPLDHILQVDGWEGGLDVFLFPRCMNFQLVACYTHLDLLLIGWQQAGD